MEFFNSAIGVLQTLVIALGAGLGIWGVINLLEGYGNDNPGAKSQGMKQLMAGAGVAVVGIVGKSKSLDFLKMLIFWSLVRNSVVLAVYLLFSVACFFTVHEHWRRGCRCRNLPAG